MENISPADDLIAIIDDPHVPARWWRERPGRRRNESSPSCPERVEERQELELEREGEGEGSDQVKGERKRVEMEHKKRTKERNKETM